MHAKDVHYIITHGIKNALILDNETEKLIKNSMSKLKNNKTTIVIAHRLSTIKDADIIVELKEGHVNDLGTHEQLVAKKDGYYYNLVKNNESDEQKEQDEKNDKLDLQRISEKRESQLRSLRKSDKLRDSVISRKSQMLNNEPELVVPLNERKHFALRVWSMNKKELVWIVLSSLAYFVNGCIYPFVAFCFSQMVKIFTITNGSENEQESFLFTGIVVV